MHLNVSSTVTVQNFQNSHSLNVHSMIGKSQNSFKFRKTVSFEDSDVFMHFVTAIIVVTGGIEAMEKNAKP